MRKREFRSQNSGQVLVIASLIVAIILLSTVAYVIETEKRAPVYQDEPDAIFSSYKSGAYRTIESALANITNGGNISVLAADLNEFNRVFSRSSYRAIINAEFTPLNDSSYANGIYLSWGSSGQATSSAYVKFAFNCSAPSSNYRSDFGIVVTSEMKLQGSFLTVNDSAIQVNATCTVLNEGKPTALQNLTVCYRSDQPSNPEWLKPDSLSETAFGNGVYLLSFVTNSRNFSEAPVILVSCNDQRGIFLQAISVCTQD
jgi:hypothetical protein